MPKAVTKTPKTQKAKRTTTSLTPQQKFARNAGLAWGSMSDTQKLKFSAKFFTFLKALRKHPGYVDMSPAELKTRG